MKARNIQRLIWAAHASLRDARSQVPPLACYGRDMHRIVGMAVAERFGRRSRAAAQERRGLVALGYCGSLIDGLKINSLLNDAEACSGVPASVWKVVGKPLAVFKYSERPFFSIANFAQVACEEPSGDEACVCSAGWCSAWRHPQTGHVVTKDLSLVEQFDPTLRQLMVKGTKFRDAFVELRRHHHRDKTPFTLREELVEMIREGCGELAKEAEARHGIPGGLFADWVGSVCALVQQRVEALSDAAIRDLDQQQEQAAAHKCAIASSAGLESLQRHFVIGEADKESGTYTLMCRAWYTSQVRRELEESGTYERAQQGADAVIQSLKPTLEDEKLWPTKVGADGGGGDDEDAEEQEAAEPDGENAGAASGGRSKKKKRKVPIVISHFYATLKTHKASPAIRTIAGGTRTPLRLLNKWIHRALWSMRGVVDKLHAAATSAVELDHLSERFSTQPWDSSWIVNQSSDVVRRLRELNSDLRRLRSTRACSKWPAARRSPSQMEFAVVDFTTLYPSLPHELVRTAMQSLLRRVFMQAGADMELAVHRDPAVEVPFRWQTEGEAEEGGYRIFTEARLMRYIDILLDNAYVRFGGNVYRQVYGIPIGAGAAPMIANFTLCYHEITGIESIVRDALADSALTVDTPWAETLSAEARRTRLLELAGRLTRCCRNIDDVLLVDLTTAEQDWCMERLYKPAETKLEFKVECRSPGSIHYLDMEVRHDTRGVYTDLYDKRVALAAAGKMDEVRPFPHIESILSEACLYNCYTGFLSRINRGVMRRTLFIKAAVDRCLSMRRAGYALQRLLHTLSVFMRHHYRPTQQASHVCMRVRRGIALGVQEEEQRERLRAEREAAAAAAAQWRRNWAERQQYAAHVASALELARVTARRLSTAAFAGKRARDCAAVITQRIEHTSAAAHARAFLADLAEEMLPAGQRPRLC